MASLIESLGHAANSAERAVVGWSKELTDYSFRMWDELEPMSEKTARMCDFGMATILILTSAILLYKIVRLCMDHMFARHNGGKAGNEGKKRQVGLISPTARRSKAGKARTTSSHSDDASVISVQIVRPYIAMEASAGAGRLISAFQDSTPAHCATNPKSAQHKAPNNDTARIMSTSTPPTAKTGIPDEIPRSPYHDPWYDYSDNSASQSRSFIPEKPKPSAPGPLLTNLHHPIPLPSKLQARAIPSMVVPNKAPAAQPPLASSTEEIESYSPSLVSSSDDESHSGQEEAVKGLYQLEEAGNVAEAEEESEQMDHLSTVSSDPPPLTPPHNPTSEGAKMPSYHWHERGNASRSGSIDSSSTVSMRLYAVQIEHDAGKQDAEDEDAYTEAHIPVKGTGLRDPIVLDLDDSIADM